MATGEDGGATANATFSSYGGGGVGGKFRRKPPRKQTTPYDRPPTVIRGNNNNNNNSSWLKKLVVEPASKLISYGADRFFASVFRPRLPSLPPPQPQPQPQPPEINNVSDGVQGAVPVPNSQDGPEEPAVRDCSQQIDSSSSNAVSELEQLLKQKTFTRSEILHLTELLQSRAVEKPDGDASLKNEEPPSDFGRHQQFASVLLEENNNGGIRSSAVLSTPILKSKAPEYDIDSPAELAKSYMGSRPSKVSPSLLGTRSQVGRRDTLLLSDVPFSSKSPTTSLSRETSASLAAPENGYITPRSRGRSAIYSMARTPYSRVHPASVFKGSGINSNGNSRLSMFSSSVAAVENDGNFESQQMTLKRRSSALDDEVGTGGPMRRIRQKPNLLAPRVQHNAHGMGIGSHAKQKIQGIGQPKHNIVGENENENVPSTSYGHVPSQSSQVAAKILQQLEKLTPKEKSPESKIVALRETSPSRLTPRMLSGQALKSTENVHSSKLLRDVQDDQKLGNRVTSDSSSQKQGKVEENGPSFSVFPFDTSNPVMNSEADVSLKASMPSNRSSVSQPPQKRRAFRMSFQEDSLEHDDDVHGDGLASTPSSEEKGSRVVALKDNKQPFEEPKVVNNTNQSGDKSASGLISSKPSELSASAVTVGEGINVTASASEQTIAASQSAIFHLPVPSDKFKETNNASSLFNFGPKVDNLSSFSSEFGKSPEAKPESSSSLFNVTASTSSQAEVPALGEGFHVNKAGDINGKSDVAPSATSNGPLALAAPVASSSDTTSRGGALLFASSSGAADSVPVGASTSATSSSSIFGLGANPTNSGGPVFKFDASVGLPTAVSAASTATITEVADLKPKANIDASSGGSSSSNHTLAAFGAASSGSSTFGLVSSSIFSKPFGAGTDLQGTSVASLPSFSNSSTSFGSSLFGSQVSNPQSTFSFSSSTPSSDSSKLAPSSGPTSSVFKFGASSTPVSDGTAVSSSSDAAAPGIFSFGISSSSSSANTASAISGVTTPIFGFSGNSVSAPATSTISSSSNGTSGIFNFGGSSSASSSAINSVSSNAAPSNVFGASWQSPKTSTFSSPFGSPSPSPAFPFGASSVSSASTSAAPIFSFTAPTASVFSSPSQPVFGNSPSIAFGASPGNNDQMNAEDSMAEDPVQSSTPSIPVFGQPSVSPSPPGFAFGSTVTQQSNPNPFAFSGQQSQPAPQNPSPFQASGSLEFNAGGSFSLGSGGGDKSGRKIVKANRNRNRKK